MSLQLFVLSDDITPATCLCASTSFLLMHKCAVTQVFLYAEMTPRTHLSMVCRWKTVHAQSIALIRSDLTRLDDERSEGRFTPTCHAWTRSAVGIHHQDNLEMTSSVGMI